MLALRDSHTDSDSDDSDDSVYSWPHLAYSTSDIYPIRPHGIFYNSDPMVISVGDPWTCLHDPLYPNHHHPSTALNGDCVQGIVVLTSTISCFPIKVTNVVDYNIFGVGKIRSNTYSFLLHPGMNIITSVSYTHLTLPTTPYV